MFDLIDAELLEELVALDESAMPSLATIWYRPITDNPRGGSTQGIDTKRNATPIPCRVVTSSGPTTRAGTGGAVLNTISTVTIALAVSAMQAQAVAIDDDDEIEVTSTIPLAGTDYDSSGRYRVIGPPLAGAYSTNLSVPVVKIT